MFALPLQLIDDFLLEVNIGQVILLLFVLAVIGGFVATRSWKVFGINLVVFGLIFLLTPIQIHPLNIQFLGLAMVIVGPLIVVLANR